MRGRFFSLPVNLFGGACLLALAAISSPAEAMSMKEAVAKAVRSNPEIGEAIANRESIEFELEQGLGLYRPRVDLEGRFTGAAGNFDSSSQDHGYVTGQASLVVRQLLFDGFGTEAEVEHQASRVDGASLRIRERSEFIALAVIREYLEMMRLQRVIGLAHENIRYHQFILGEISAGTQGGSISVADRQQAQERLLAARASLVQFEEDLRASQVTFIRLVGQEPGKLSSVIKINGKLPNSLKAALKWARERHPSVRFAQADIDAAAALVKAAESKFYPKLSLEGRGQLAKDVDGDSGEADDMVRGDLVMNWNLYNGGIDTANKQEQIRHVDESYQRLYRITREVEEGVRLSWNRRFEQNRKLRTLLQELSAINQLRGSYLEQFKIGERSLLDLLDTQNTRFSLQVAVATSDSAVKFADYRILAASGALLKSIGISPPPQAQTYARQDYDVPPTLAPDDYERIDPPTRK